jgi:tellurite resistance protein
MSDSTLSSSWLEHVPPTLFGAVMGITGLGLAWRKANEVLGLPEWPSTFFLVIGGIVFTATTILYMIKSIRHPDAVRSDTYHPVKSNFFSAFSIAFMLQAIAILPFNPQWAEIVFFLATAVNISFTAMAVSWWMSRPFKIEMIDPTWIIPGVSSWIVAVAVGPLGYIDIGWFFFSIGMVFWTFLMTLIFYRLVFLEKLPRPLYSMMFILMVPPALSSLAFQDLIGGEIAVFTRVMHSFSLFLILMMILKIRVFLSLPFNQLAWSYTFSTVSVTFATIVHGQLMQNQFMLWLAIPMIAVTTLIVVKVFLKTLLELIRGKLFIPDHVPAQVT